MFRWAIVLAAGLAAGCSVPMPNLALFGGREAPAAQPAEPVVFPPVTVAGLTLAEDGTVLVPAVRLATAERGRQGTILRAEGVAPTQGFHSPELRTVGEPAGGIVAVELRARPPVEREAVGPERTRLLSVGRHFTNREMREVRGFRVIAGQNTVGVAAP